MSEATISLTMAEEIPTVQYGNVTIGPMTITRQCEDTVDARQETMDSIAAELKDWYVEQRDILTTIVRDAYKNTGQATKH